MLKLVQANAKAIAAVVVIVLFVLYALSYMTEGMDNTTVTPTAPTAYTGTAPTTSNKYKRLELVALIDRLYPQMNPSMSDIEQPQPSHIEGDDELITMLRTDYDALIEKEQKQRTLKKLAIQKYKEKIAASTVNTQPVATSGLHAVSPPTPQN